MKVKFTHMNWTVVRELDVIPQRGMFIEFDGTEYDIRSVGFILDDDETYIYVGVAG